MTLSHEPSCIPLAGPVSIRGDDLHFRFVASGGPGGQNVNKTATKAELRLALQNLTGLPMDAALRLQTLAGRFLNAEGELVLVNQETRSQRQNREAVLSQLRQLVAAALIRPKRRKKTRPSRGAKERRLEAKRKQSQLKRERSPHLSD